jgi:hypothetical protein
MRKALIVLCIVAATVLGSTSAAQAAPPSNDDITNATVITAPSFTDSLNTRQATAAPVDRACGAATVWYQYTPTATTALQMDAYGYQTFIGLFSGDPANPSYLGCTQYSLYTTLTAGETYFISVGSSYWGPPPPGAVGPGGDLTVNINLQEIPPPLTTVTATLDSATVTRYGIVTLTGTVTCDQVATAYVYGTLLQRYQRMLAQGSIYSNYVTCGPEPTTWTAQVSSSTAIIFDRGAASLQADLYAYDGWGNSASASLSGDIRLQRQNNA